MSGRAGVGFFEAIGTCFRKYAVFTGRAPRSELWWWILFQFIINLGLESVILPGMIQRMAEIKATGVMPPLDPLTSLEMRGFVIYTLALFLPNLAVQVRRLHDIDRSGWWLLGVMTLPFGGGFIAVFLSAFDRASSSLFLGLTVLAVLAAWVLLLVWFCTRGTAGNNRFGRDPLADEWNGKSWQ